ncbi:MAG: DUF3450 domain-containing protein [Desulfobacterales bacterium]
MRKYQLFGIPVMGILVPAAVIFLSAAVVNAEDLSEKIKGPVERTVDIRRRTQEAEDQWAAEKEKLTARYEMLEEKLGHLQEQNEELAKEIRYREDEIASLTKRIKDAGRISKEIKPYLRVVVDRLKRIVNTGSPFLMAERTKRVEALDTMLADPELDISEKYRKTMEAVLIEAEYGNTVEVYSEKIEAAGRPMQARIFRLGRVSLFFQSLDQEYSGYYDVLEKQWRFLPAKFNEDITMAIEMASKRRPIEVVNLPLGEIAVE